MFFFFILEKFLVWRHCHTHAHEETAHRHTSASMVLVGDAIHNFIDGTIVASAYMAGTSVGLAVTAAILLHEIPQELGDFAIMLHSGFSRARTFLWNGVSSLAMIAGALLAWWQLPLIERYLAHVIAFTAASFIYIAVADLIPSLHRGVKLHETLAQVALLVAGIALIGLFHGH